MNHAAYSLSCVTHAGDTSPNVPEFTPVGSSAGVGSHLANGVGQRLYVISDEEREAAILRAGKSLERHMALREAALLEYDVTGDFAAKGLADRHRIFADYAQRIQADLIRGRSQEQIQKMERERGLA